MPPWSGTARARCSADGPPAGGLILEVLARPPVDRRGAGLVRRHLDARDLGVRRGGTRYIERAAGVDRGDDGRDAALRGRLGAAPRRPAARPRRSGRRHSVVEKSAAAPAIETDSSSSGVSPLVPIAPTTSPSTFSGMPPVRHEAPWSASAPSRPSLTCSSISRLGRTKIAAVRALSTATRRARDLRARRAPQRDELAGRIDDGDHDPVAAARSRGARAAAITASAPGVVDDPSRPRDGHVRLLSRCESCSTAQTASSVVMNRTLRSGRRR